MSRAWVLAALLLTSDVVSGQANGVLRVSLTLSDATQTAVPIGNHSLFISDNPPSRAPRRVVTAADGTVVVHLAPGSYTVESDRPVAFHGKGYQWVAIADIVAGRETTLALTVVDAEVVPLTATVPEVGAGTDTAASAASDIGKWQTSVVTIWSPTALASGFVIDSSGLVATDRNAVGAAASVEVQISSTVKVPGRVLVAEPAHDVAIVWVDPGALAAASAVPLQCPATTSLEMGSEIVAMTASPRGVGDAVTGEITGFHPRGMETDLRLSFGEAGGPVLAGNPSGLVGLTSVGPGEDGRREDVRVVRAGILCETLSAARSKMSGAAPPAATPLPVEPTLSSSIDAPPAQATSGTTAPPVVSSSSFDVAFITPTAVLRARERADRTGGQGGRAPEAEARLGRLTDFGAWAEYFADVPPVLVVRVTPKLVEGFWMRLAREAARVQGAALPALKDFKTNFVRLRAACGAEEVTAIHPFVVEHAIGEQRVLREGLYVFSPHAFGPQCSNVTLTMTSEQAPEKAETLTVDPQVINQIWQDLAPYRAARQ